MHWCKLALSVTDLRKGTAFWGPPYWITIHTLAVWATKPWVNSEKLSGPRQFRAFMHALVQLIPCGECSDHLRSNLESLPITDEMIRQAENGDQHVLPRWSWEFHDRVNQQTGNARLPYQTFVGRMNDLVHPNCWGPSIWRFLHSAAAYYEPGIRHARKSYLATLTVLSNLIPEHQGGVLLRAILKQNKPQNRHWRNNVALFEWTHFLHTVVNSRLGKRNLSMKDAKKFYMG